MAVQSKQVLSGLFQPDQGVIDARTPSSHDSATAVPDATTESAVPGDGDEELIDCHSEVSTEVATDVEEEYKTGTTFTVELDFVDNLGGEIPTSPFLTLRRVC